MDRLKPSINTNGVDQRLQTLKQILVTINASAKRQALANRLGQSYQGDRKLYEALGYPREEDLTYEYFENKYKRQEIAKAIIDKPVDATWGGSLLVTEEDEAAEESTLNDAWLELNKEFGVKKRLNKLDKLAGVGHYSVLLFGFKDIKKLDDWAQPATGKKELTFLKQLSEEEASIHKLEKNTKSKRFGQPLLYKVRISEDTTGVQGNRDSISVRSDTTVRGQSSSSSKKTTDILVHHTRVIHVKDGELTSEIFGTPRLKPIINRLEDLEKILGGDAEMFWRNARPGYHAKPDENFSISDDTIKALEDELDKYEHDLRRFITAEGTDIKALTQEVASPKEHFEIQIKAISSQTGIPKRILEGSERGELASSQDRDQWLSLIKNRMTEFAEFDIFRPFIDKCMSHGILPEEEKYTVIWEDIFAPSEAEKVEVGKKRSDALKVYSDSLFAAEIMPPKLALKLLLGLTQDQIQEVQQVLDEQTVRGDGTGEEDGNESEVRGTGTMRRTTV